MGIKSKQNVQYVFVYGTLKVGGKFAGQLNYKRITTQPAEVIGDLFNISGRYPGLILGGHSVVTGEIHKYIDTHEALEIMDRIEGFNEQKPETSLFKRTTTEVLLENNDVINAYVYEINADHNDLIDAGYKMIDNGTWEI